MKKALKHIKRILIVTAVVIAVVCAALFGCILYLRTFVSEPVRQDKDGKLYYMEYKGDYTSPLVTVPINMVKPVRKAGCSCFSAQDPDGGYITGRNYDLPHFDKQGNETGLNVVLECAPENGCRSIGTADAVWLSLLGQPYYAGGIDDPKTEKACLALLPYLCMDGMNEKGLTVSILYLDVKDGEQAVYQQRSGKQDVILPVLLRQMLDSCATVEEAVALADERNVVNIFGADFHLFVTDAAGRSAVLEWRYNEMTVTYTDIVTNFYVSWDDAEDCYKDGQLKEKYISAQDADGYRFGYGHGYERFATIMHRSDEYKINGQTVMDTAAAMDTLKAVSQEYTGELTSLTQYSTVYHNNERSMDICIYPDYTEVYHFTLS